MIPGAGPLSPLVRVVSMRITIGLFRAFFVCAAGAAGWYLMKNLLDPEADLGDKLSSGIDEVTASLKRTSHDLRNVVDDIRDKPYDNNREAV